MVKIAFVLLLSFVFSFSKSNIDSKIEKTNQELLNKKEREKVLNKSLDEIGEQIIKEEKELEELKVEIERLSILIEETKAEYEIKNSEYKKLTESKDELSKIRKGIEKDIIDAIAKNLSFEIIKNEVKPSSENELLNREIFETLSNVAATNIKNLKANYEKVSNELNKLEEERKSVAKFLEQVQKDLAALNNANKKKSKLLVSLKLKKEQYDKELEQTRREQEELQSLLAKLDIMKRDEEEMQKQRVTIKDQKQNLPKPDVKILGSSYQESKTIKYTGKKTIPPLDDFEIIREFGPYFDPVYKIKVFNESVELKPKEADAKVKSVFDGKVVFAKEMPVLDKVVIIEHHDNIHTIYARLSKIAPTLKTGMQVKKGYVIGRVDDMLTFEVTQKNYHINPLELISF